MADGGGPDVTVVLRALQALVESLRGFDQYGVCCLVIDRHAAFGACGEPAHWIEFRAEGGRLFYCDRHVEQRPDPRIVQLLPHAGALREAQRILKEPGCG